jgi:PEGA domain
MDSRGSLVRAAAASLLLAWAVFPAHAEKNLITGEVRFEGVTHVEKKAGVWIDGQYLGYLKELKGKRKIVLLPGDHQIVVRRAGYDDFVKPIVIEPGEGRTVRVIMYKTRGLPPREETAKLKFSVKPKRAAVFLDDQFMGPAGDFGGSMKVTPGRHTVKIELLGYRTYQTSVDAVEGKKTKVKLDLAKGSVRDAGPLVRAQARTER